MKRKLWVRGFEVLLAFALLSTAALAAWQLNRPYPLWDEVLTQGISTGAVLLDARGPLLYRRGHIPQAHHLWPRDLLSFEGEVPGTLAEPKLIEDRLRSLGLEPGQTVVIYDNGDYSEAALLALILHSFGVHAKVLQGGLEGWLAQGGNLASEAPNAPLPSEAEFPYNHRLLVNAEEAREHLSEALIAPLDVRPTEAYLQGHIETAVNIEESSFWPSGQLPRWSALHSELLQRRITLDTHPLVYGEDLQQAARAWLALRAYGHDFIHVYAGPYGGLVAAGLPISETASREAVSTRSQSVCWR